MTADKRTVATDALDTLGMVIDETAKRDAIHLAVEPVIAGDKLRPGQPIQIENGYAYPCDFANALGIVDPFLERAVERSERFWFIMKPRMIRSLRHVWEHEAFPSSDWGLTGPARADSEKWLREFCAKADCPGYEAVMALISEVPDAYGLHGYDEGSVYFDGIEAHGHIPPIFWIHVENVLGRKVPFYPAKFSCSC